MGNVSNYRILFEAVLNDTNLKAGVNKLISSNSNLQKSFTATQANAQKTAKTVTATAGATANANTKMNHSVNNMGTGLKGMAGQWLNITKKVLAFGAATAVIGGATKVVGAMVKNVVDLNKASVELQKVSNFREGTQSLKDFTAEAFKVGKTIAKTGTEVVVAATEFSRAGYADKDITELGRVALLYQNISDEEISVADSASVMIAMTKAFKKESLTAIHAVDEINAVANAFAVSSADIGTALPKVASTMALAGNTSAEAIGLLTAGTEMMPHQASRVARGLRSITLNLQGMTDKGVKSLDLTAKMEKNFNKIGITLKDKTTGQLKSTYQIMGELSKVFPNLTSDQKKYYAALIGGKQQVDVVSAVLSNFSHAVGATETAVNSAGSAAKENAIYMEGIEGRIAGFNTEFQNLSQQLIKTDLIKNIVSFGTGFLKTMTAADALTPKVVLVTVAVWGLSKAFAFVTAQAKWMAGTSGIVGMSKVFSALALVFDFLTGKTVIYTLAQKALIENILLLAPALAVIAGVGIYLYKNVNNLAENLKLIDDTKAKIKGYSDELTKLNDKLKKNGRITQAEEDRRNLLKEEKALAIDILKATQATALIQFGASNKKVSVNQTTGEQTTTYESDKRINKYKADLLAIENLKANARKAANDADKATSTADKEYFDKKAKAANLALVKKQAETEADKVSINSLTEDYKKMYDAQGGAKDVNEASNERRLKSWTAAFTLAEGGSTDFTRSLETMGREFGVVVDESGKLESVNMDVFVKKLQDAGATAPQIADILTTLKKTGKVRLDGTKDDITLLLQKLGFTDTQIKSILKHMKLVNNTPVEPKINNTSTNKTANLWSNMFGAWSTFFGTGGKKTGTFNIKTTGSFPTIPKWLGGSGKTNAKGTDNADDGISGINEKGWELIQSKDGKVRIANDGKNGATQLNKGDKVYTHEESVKMISGDDDVQVQGHASGTHAISTKAPSRGHFAKETSGSFGSKKDSLDYSLAMGYISEQKYYEKLTALRTSYYKAGKISLADYRQVNEDVHAYNEKLKEEAYDKEVKRLGKLQDKYTAQQELLNKYAEQQVAKIDKKIEGYEKEKEEITKQNDESEKANALMEANMKLAEAKNTKIKVYRAGKGFGYESDESAVSDAQKEVDALKAQYAMDDKIAAIDDKIAKAEEEKAKWSDTTSKWQDEQDIKNLEQTAGVTLASISKSVDGSLSKFDSAYSTTGANLEGITDALSKTEDTNKVQSATTIANLIKANKHASGTSSAQGGLSLVGEQGAELRVLRQGDGILPNNITKNLMDIGRFNAKELISAKSAISRTDGTNITEFNFGAGSIVVEGDNAETLANDIINNMNRIVQQNEKKRN